MPDISIIIPTKNCPQLLNWATNSILKQTYEDWKLFIINDSTGKNLPEPSSGFEHDGKHYNKN